MKRSVLPGLLLTVLLSSGAFSDVDGEAMFKYRSKVMYASIGHLEALQAYVKGELPLQSRVPGHVDALLELNAMYQHLFPAESGHPDSKALPMIWSDPQGVRQAIEHNRRAIVALGQVDPGDLASMKRAVNQVRMSCGDCHYYFRAR
jgi:cytochrome c556